MSLEEPVCRRLVVREGGDAKTGHGENGFRRRRPHGRIEAPDRLGHGRDVSPAPAARHPYAGSWLLSKAVDEGLLTGDFSRLVEWVAALAGVGALTAYLSPVTA